MVGGTCNSGGQAGRQAGVGEGSGGGVGMVAGGVEIWWRRIGASGGDRVAGGSGGEVELVGVEGRGRTMVGDDDGRSQRVMGEGARRREQETPNLHHHHHHHHRPRPRQRNAAAPRNGSGMAGRRDRPAMGVGTREFAQRACVARGRRAMRIHRSNHTASFSPAAAAAASSSSYHPRHSAEGGLAVAPTTLFCRGLVSSRATLRHACAGANVQPALRAGVSWRVQRVGWAVLPCAVGERAIVALLIDPMGVSELRSRARELGGAD